MRRVGEALRSCHVGRIYLIHGTFVGLDAGGLFGELGRVLPSVREALATRWKRNVDALAGDRGNFTAAYARRLDNALNDTRRAGSVSDQSFPGRNTTIDVRLFHWSSENHHLGRAEGAVRLLDELLTAPLEDGRRTLLIGHSHAGNVFALLTNLLSGDGDAVAEFFAAARTHFRWPILHRVDVPVWEKMADKLRDEPRPLDARQLDFVTLGTPIRYGWYPGGYGRLLHIVSHRRTPGLPPYQAKFPFTFDEVLRATGGDYVQQIGIAGTNSPPSWIAPRACWADWRLHRLLQRDVSGDLFTRLKFGQRVHDAGETLLVDYGEQPANLLQHLAGHGLYTQESLMLWQFERIVERLCRV